MKVYSYYDFQVCPIQEDDDLIYRTRIGDNQMKKKFSHVGYSTPSLQENLGFATTPIVANS
jgi:hypothetical protein